MGIYISGVKGLPEQVQENKEKIATIEEEISGIDWDAIHNLENQVAENTQDINNMEGTIGTQNIAITQLGGRVDDLEDKTQEITRDSDNNITQVGEDLHVEGNISLGDGKSIILGTDGHNAIESSGNANSYMDFDSSDNPEIASNGNVYKFTNTGITLNGTPVGGGSSDYFTIKFSGTYTMELYGSINKDDFPTSGSNLRAYLINLSFNSNNKIFRVNGYYTQSTDTYIILGLYASGSAIYGKGLNISDGQIYDITLATPGNWTINKITM